MVRFIILGLIDMKPMSAYEFDKLLTDSIKNFYNIKQSQVYIEFKKLKALGFLTSESTILNNRVKEIYKVTDLGRKEFFKLQEEIDVEAERYLDVKLLFLVRTFFGFYLSDEKNILFLEKLKTIVTNKIKTLENQASVIKNSESNNSKNRDKWYWQQTIKYGLNSWNYTLKWIDELIIGIKNKEWENN
ncbi:PadR family transcriptional regulator [Malacoplasma iowae]|uniref:PadR family transcriptional regulator n=1 Tax=Malacoplasma iowae TaxID=2116 RepID=UPI002A18E12B|nr:helix-turn-helix transcriptional regulator [Malacoplasma iowae]WPL39653.1 helix-turn-helix transcriptional regulator [Malacoplasma iowae]